MLVVGRWTACVLGGCVSESELKQVMGGGGGDWLEPEKGGTSMPASLEG